MADDLHTRDPGHDADRRRIRPPDPEPAPARADEAVALAADVGNRAFAGAVTEPGAGLTAAGGVHPAVERALDTARGGGTGLDPRLQDRFADTLGDLSDVRVHTDDTAQALARSVSARAFATGTDVYFGAGEYRPGSPDGDRLIAHELAHAVQQRGAPSSGPLSVSQPGDAAERQADAVADRL